MTEFNSLLDIKKSILRNFDFAFKVDWDNPHHKQIHRHLTALTMYFGIKFNGHISYEGSFLAYRFNDRKNVDKHVHKFRTLFKNESLLTFKEEECDGCYIFTI